MLYFRTITSDVDLFHISSRRAQFWQTRFRYQNTKLCKHV